MSGIYIHIPFCRQACHYCDFHFSTNLSLRSSLLAAIQKEIELRKEEIEKHHRQVRTLYLGGGTPSLLTIHEIEMLFDTLKKNFDLSDVKETTLEANPEDITADKLSGWAGLGIDRISIGIQSLNDEHLRYINRSHTRKQALRALELIAGGPIDNFTADLIFGIPPFDLGVWESELDRLISYDIPHLSIYGLTIEPRTVFGHRLKKGHLLITEEERMADAFRLAHERLIRAGFDHYEISNYAQSGRHSRHNSAYWNGEKYIGLGPGAHSYDGQSRMAAISNNPRYIKSIRSGQLPHQTEILTPRDRANELILTQLRTRRGLDLSLLAEDYGIDLLADYEGLVRDWTEQGLIQVNPQNHLVLTIEGMLLADEISLKMFYGC